MIDTTHEDSLSVEACCVDHSLLSCTQGKKVDTHLYIPKAEAEIFNPYNKSVSPYDQKCLQNITEKERVAGIELTNVCKKMLDVKSDVLHELQSNFNIPLLTISDRFNHSGLLTNENDGEVEIYFPNGDYFWGYIRDGMKEGPASVVLQSGETLEGNFERDKLEGLVVETLSSALRP